METQLSVQDIAAAIGPENLLLRLVALQRRVAELEAIVAAMEGVAEVPAALAEAIARNGG